MKNQTTIRARPMKMPGNRPIMNSLVMDAGIAVGADGLFIETHENPAVAKSEIGRASCRERV